MNILTDEEISELKRDYGCRTDDTIWWEAVRAIEAAIMERFEIAGYQWLDTAHFLEKIPSYATEYEWRPLYALKENK